MIPIGKITTIFGLLAFLFAFGALIQPIEGINSLSLPILVFIGTLIVFVVVGIAVPGIHKLYALGLVAISGMMIFVTCCI